MDYQQTTELSVVSEDKPESTPGTFQNTENPTYYYSMHILKSEISQFQLNEPEKKAWKATRMGLKR